ncbi:MAG TPA: hypothetical protein VFX52_04980 [Nocardioidaceae bacterium]|nr:hypothetical protein [Nocardioidaceae bacterium]
MHLGRWDARRSNQPQRNRDVPTRWRVVVHTAVVGTDDRDA